MVEVFPIAEGSLFDLIFGLRQDDGEKLNKWLLRGHIEALLRKLGGYFLKVSQRY